MQQGVRPPSRVVGRAGQGKVGSSEHLPTADDSCPICCDDLECVALTLLVDGGRGGVRAHVAARQLSKCMRCGSVAHTECVFAMMIAGSGKPGNNPCAVCRPSP